MIIFVQMEKGKIMIDMNEIIANNIAILKSSNKSRQILQSMNAITRAVQRMKARKTK